MLHVKPSISLNTDWEVEKEGEYSDRERHWEIEYSERERERESGTVYWEVERHNTERGTENTER